MISQSIRNYTVKANRFLKKIDNLITNLELEKGVTVYTPDLWSSYFQILDKNEKVIFETDIITNDFIDYLDMLAEAIDFIENYKGE